MKAAYLFKRMTVGSCCCVNSQNASEQRYFVCLLNDYRPWIWYMRCKTVLDALIFYDLLNVSVTQ